MDPRSRAAADISSDTSSQHEGTNDIAWGLIAFDSLASYERYRAGLRDDPAARENFRMAREQRFILREERSFVELVDGTFALAPTSAVPR